MAFAPQLVDPQSPETTKPSSLRRRSCQRAGAVKGDAALAQLHLRQWALGEPQTQLQELHRLPPQPLRERVAPGLNRQRRHQYTSPGALHRRQPLPPSSSASIRTARERGERDADGELQGRGTTRSSLSLQAEAERFAFYQQAPPGTRAAVTPRVAKAVGGREGRSTLISTRRTTRISSRG